MSRFRGQKPRRRMTTGGRVRRMTAGGRVRSNVTGQPLAPGHNDTMGLGSDTGDGSSRYGRDCLPGGTYEFPCNSGMCDCSWAQNNAPGATCWAWARCPFGSSCECHPGVQGQAGAGCRCVDHHATK